MPNANDETGAAPVDNGASQAGASAKKRTSIMKWVAFATALAAAAAIGFVAGEGLPILFSSFTDELDPNSRVALELDRLNSEIDELREVVASNAIPNPVTQRSLEEQRQSLENRINGLEARLVAMFNSRDANSGRFELFAKADRELAARLEEQQASAAILESEKSAKLDSFGQRLSMIEGSLANQAELEGRFAELQSEMTVLMNLSGEIGKLRMEFLEAEAETDASANAFGGVSGSNGTASQEQRLAALEGVFAEFREESASALETAKQDITELGSRIGTLANASDGVVGSEGTAFQEQRLAALEGVFAEFKEESASALETNKQDIAELSSRIGALANATGESAESETTASQEQRLAALEVILAEFKEESVSTLETTKREIVELGTRISALANAPDGALESEEVATQAQRLAELEGLFANFKEDSVSALDSVRQEIKLLDSEIRNSLDSSATRIAYSRIFGAIYEGLPYSQFLGEVDWVQPEERAFLRRHADSGVESMDGLQEIFLRLARETLKVEQTEGESGQGVTSFLKSLVVVRPLSPQEGDDVGSVLSRAEEALKGGRLQVALDLVESLPESSRGSMKEWNDTAKTRLAVLDAIRISDFSPPNERQE